MPLETNLNMEDLTMWDKTALTIAIIGALNWGSIGIFGFDLVAALLGAGSMASRIVYTIVGLAGLWCISLLFRHDEVVRHSHI